MRVSLRGKSGWEGVGLIHSGRGQVERVKARRKTSSAGTGEEGRGGDKSGKLRCVGDAA